MGDLIVCTIYHNFTEAKITNRVPRIQNLKPANRNVFLNPYGSDFYDLSNMFTDQNDWEFPPDEAFLNLKYSAGAYISE